MISATHDPWIGPMNKGITQEWAIYLIDLAIWYDIMRKHMNKQNESDNIDLEESKRTLR